MIDHSKLLKSSKIANNCKLDQFLSLFDFHFSSTTLFPISFAMNFVFITLNCNLSKMNFVSISFLISLLVCRVNYDNLRTKCYANGPNSRKHELSLSLCDNRDNLHDLIVRHSLNISSSDIFILFASSVSFETYNKVRIIPERSWNFTMRFLLSITKFPDFFFSFHSLLFS